MVLLVSFGLRAATPAGLEEEGTIVRVPDVVPGEIIVRFRDQTPAIRRQNLVETFGGTWRWLGGLKGSRARVAVQANGGGGDEVPQIAVLRLTRPETTQRVIRSLAQDPSVLYAEPNYRVRILAPGPFVPRPGPDDYEFGRQWSLRSPSREDGQPAVDIGMTNAWKLATGDRRVKVAIIDTGIDYFHPDLEANVWNNPDEIPENGIDDDGNGYVDDVHGFDFVSGDGDPFDDSNHGTHVAGIIGAVGNNQQGIAGICWNVSLMGLKAFDEAGDSDIGYVVEAIDYAIAERAQVINASWGGADKSVALEDAVNRAHRAGAVFVAAAGNEHVDTPPAPASYPVTLAVGATDQNDQRAFFSNFGSWVDLAAPGSEIYSTYPDAAFDISSGTSMSAPHVSGVAALVLGLHPEFSNTDVENVLLNTARAITADHPLGVGRLDAGKALAVEEKLPNARLVLPEVIQGLVDVVGTADGETFASYELAISVRGVPSERAEDWVVLARRTAPVTDGVLLAGFDTSSVTDGVHVMRLVAVGRSGQISRSTANVEVRNVRVTHPLHNDVLRAGEMVEVEGSVFGGGLEYEVSVGSGWSPTQWTTNGIEILTGGREERLRQKLARWDTSKVPANNYYTLRLAARRGGRLVAEHQVPMIYLDGQLRQGWPLRLPIAEDFPVEDWRQVVAEDLDGDGVQELILLDHGNSDGKLAELKVFRLNGTLVWSRVIGSGEPYSDVPVVGDLDGDGRSEIVVEAGDRREIRVFHGDGQEVLDGWPVRVGAGNLGKLLVDLDHDGTKELVTLSMDTTSGGESGYRQLTVFSSKGAVVRQWNIPACEFEGDAPELLPAVGNLDSDDDLEIVTNYGCNGVAMFDLGKSDGPVWSTHADGVFRSAPVVGDLDGDGRDEIVLGSYDALSLNRGGIYVFDGSGRRWRDFPVLLEESFVNASALADLDGDGALEICVASSNPRRIHVLRHQGFEMDGWPIGQGLNGIIRSGPVVGDVDGDGRPDVVVPIMGSMRQVVSFGDFTRTGGVMAWRADGTPISWGGGQGPRQLVMEGAGGGTRLKASPATLTDLDGDGKLDVVAMSIQEASYDLGDAPVVRKNRASLYVWRVDVPFKAEAMPWPTWQRDAGRSGYSVPKPKINTPPRILNIPNQIARSGGEFFVVRLDRYVEDQQESAAQLKWAVAGAAALRVEVAAGHRLIVTPPEVGWKGREELTLTVTDAGGLTDSRRVTFEMRPDYQPPVVLGDAFEMIEDGELVMDVLANDRDAQGAAVQVLEFSRAEHGRVGAVSGGKLRYIPEADYVGKDAFTYSAIDRSGGVALATVEITVTPVNDAPLVEADKVLVTEDEPVEMDVLANDVEVDGESMQLVSHTPVAHGTLTALGGGRFSFLATTNYFGSDRFTYTVRDASGLESVGEVLLTVKPVVDLPVVQDQSLTVNRNQSREITYLADNPDGSKLTYRIVEGPKHGDLYTYPEVATYIPKQGYSGRDSLTYVANNGFDDGPTGTISFLVTNTNNPPKLDGLTVSTKPGRLLSLPIAVSDNDLDPVELELRQKPAHGVVTGAGTNWTYQSAVDYLGEDQFTIVARDAESTSPEVAIRVRVTDVNTTPRASDSKMDVMVNTSTNLIFSVKDDESDPLTYEILSLPQNGQLKGDSPRYTYTPRTDYLGFDQITFRVSDGLEWSSSAVLTLLVRSPNEPPTTTNQYLSVLTGKVLNASLSVVDTDGDRLRTPVLKGPKHGRLVVRGTNFVYTPFAGYLGGDTFTYRVWDGHRYSPVGKVTISVESPVPPPRPSIAGVKVLSNGQVNLLVRCGVGAVCRVEASDNLVNWKAVTTLTMTTTETQWQDAQTGEFRRRFYRVILESFPQP